MIIVPYYQKYQFVMSYSDYCAKKNQHYIIHFVYNTIYYSCHYVASLLQLLHEVFNNNENFLRMCTYTINYYACCVYIYYSKTQCNIILCYNYIFFVNNRFVNTHGIYQIISNHRIKTQGLLRRRAAMKEQQITKANICLALKDSLSNVTCWQQATAASLFADDLKKAGPTTSMALASARPLLRHGLAYLKSFS